jgi:spermidine synthase
VSADPVLAPAPPAISIARLRIVYAVAIFLNSFLLFLLEPIAGKRLLPLLGGSSAVWITCLVFFQVALLLGYLAADVIAARIPAHAQTATYLALLVTAVVQAGIAVRLSLEASTEHPVASVFRLLTVLIGLPFILLCATSPLLQAWYARAAGRAGDSSSPYRLFAVSNLGSLLALVFYPWLIEPNASLHAQNLAWFVAFVVLALLAGAIAWQARDATRLARTGEREGALAPTLGVRFLWLMFAACGSLLLCAVTSYLTTRVVAMPLLWIAPLVMYLLSFVIAFRGWYPRRTVLVLLALVLGAMAFNLYDYYADLSQSPHKVLQWLDHVADSRVKIPLFCFGLLIACLFCHAELHRRRPVARHLTGFYFILAAGGALGSIFVGVVAPVIFRDSYELAVGMILTAALAAIISIRLAVTRLIWLLITAAMVMVLGYQVQQSRANAITRLRSFYGVLRVTENTYADDPAPRRTLFHGPTEHGVQFEDPDLRREPTSYYTRDSGIGLALDLCCGSGPRRIGVVGLGAGSLAAYGKEGDVIRFYEIDPLVERVARRDFTYLSDTPARVDVVLGDARLSLEHEPPQRYNVLAVDAFSGDAIPVHLLTSEAFALYKRHLAPGGIIAVHVSSHFLDLPPLVKLEAGHAGMSAVLISVDEDPDSFGYASDWVLVSADKDFLARREISAAKSEIKMPPRLRLWTDDDNSLLPVFHPQD